MKQSISLCFTLIFYPRAIVKQDPNIAHLLRKAIFVLWRTRFRIHRYVAMDNRDTSRQICKDLKYENEAEYFSFYFLWTSNNLEKELPLALSL